jgi:hypothetical protein
MWFDFYADQLQSMEELAFNTNSDPEFVGAVMATMMHLLAMLPADGAEKMLAALPQRLHAIRSARESDEAAEKADQAIQAAMRG